MTSTHQIKFLHIHNYPYFYTNKFVYQQDIMRKLSITFIVVLSGFLSHAQVKGTVIDSAAKKPIDKAVIGMVVKSNPTDTSYTFTDEKGQFRFETVPSSRL